MITGFFPGRIRLRAPIFKDTAITQRALAILKQSSAVKRIEHNPITGSILLEYSPAHVPIEKLRPLLPFFKKLEKEAASYSEKNRNTILTMLDELDTHVKSLPEDIIQ